MPELFSYTTRRDFDTLRCPTCGNPVRAKNSIDNFLVKLECEQNSNHIFLVYLKNKTMAGPHFGDKEFTFEGRYSEIPNMFSNFEFRSRLEIGYAVMLRRIYEIMEEGVNVGETITGNFRYCPFCGDILDRHEIQDAYFEGKKCENNHLFRQRHGLESEGGDLRLHIDLANRKLANSVREFFNYYLKPRREHLLEHGADEHLLKYSVENHGLDPSILKIFLSFFIESSKKSTIPQ